jgi:hypothetical protein
LSVNPSSIPGTGIVKMYLYQNGFPNSGDTLTWVITSSAVGIKEISADNKLRIFPNPVKEKISLDINTVVAENAAVEILDVTGRSLMKSSLQVNSLDVGALLPGVYSLILESSGKRLVKQFVKE